MRPDYTTQTLFFAHRQHVPEFKHFWEGEREGAFSEIYLNFIKTLIIFIIYKIEMVSSCNIGQFEGGITSSERLLLDKALFKGWLVMTSTSMCMLRGKLWLTISILPNRHLPHELVNLSTHNCLFLFVVCKFVLVFDHVGVALCILIVQEDSTWSFWLTSKASSSRIASFRRC